MLQAISGLITSHESAPFRHDVLLGHFLLPISLDNNQALRIRASLAKLLDSNEVLDTVEVVADNIYEEAATELVLIGSADYDVTLSAIKDVFHRRTCW